MGRQCPSTLVRARSYRITSASRYDCLDLLKGVAEAIEHCTQNLSLDHNDNSHLRLEMAASAKARLAFRIGLCRTSKPYSSQFVSDHGDVLLVTNISNSTNSSLDAYEHAPDSFDNSGYSVDSYRLTNNFHALNLCLCWYIIVE
jgi:hypothetical protein